MVSLEVVRAAQGGKMEALEQVVRAIQDKVYGLALRMLWNPEDAREATQEILLRVVTHLGGFKGESAFSTWVYRVAANHLLTAKRSRVESEEYTFERFASELEEGLLEPDWTEEDNTSPERALLLEEIKIGCTLGMLSCLDRAHRLAYILGEILELEGSEGASILQISPAAFRQRLSQARADIIRFTSAHCGLVNPQSACRCRKRVEVSVRSGRVDPRRPNFATDLQRAQRFPQVLAEIRRLEGARRTAALYRSHPDARSPEDFARAIERLLGPSLAGSHPSD